MPNKYENFWTTSDLGVLRAEKCRKKIWLGLQKEALDADKLKE